ncbi:hypothetical protein [Actinomyces mediterranea]|uniref:hypothetical protein n=1 Tax=Actinomyces mediterranea TaxID=1871028 RepID=UPI000970431D|nr:hypothetical protein [Actinomyces mediterranea]
MARILDFVSARGAIMRLKGLSQQNFAALKAIVEMLDADGFVSVADLFEKLYPYENKLANLNRGLNRLISAVNKAAKEQNLALSMCVTAAKSGGPAARRVWFEGPDLEAPQFDTDTLRAIPEGQLAE